jgi:hypothetical protein
MSQPLRLLTDQEFAALTTEEKFNYLNEIISSLLGDRAKAAEETPALRDEDRPAQDAPEQP